MISPDLIKCLNFNDNFIVGVEQGVWPESVELYEPCKGTQFMQFFYTQ